MEYTRDVAQNMEIIRNKMGAESVNLWQKMLENDDDDEMHHKFILFCVPKLLKFYINILC
jgi:hypothetical protein